jgi:hypothetical protein
VRSNKRHHFLNRSLLYNNDNKQLFFSSFLATWVISFPSTPF